MEVKVNSDNSFLLVVSSGCDVQGAYGLTMSAPFEHGMDIVIRSSNATNNSIATPQIGERLLNCGMRNEGGLL